MENMEYAEAADKDQGLNPGELAVLEDKIEKLVEFCLKLQDENRGLKHSLEDRIQEVETLTSRLGQYDEMRQDVRERINRLVRTIEELESSTGESSTEGDNQDAQDESYPSQPELLSSESHEE